VGPPAPAQSEYPLETYRFSEPRIALTHPGAIGIAGWLPDGQRLLITRDVPGTNRQTIDVLDVQTGELITYAEREGNSGKPVWLPALQAVAYLTLVAEKGEEQPIRYHPELWVSYGTPQQVERLTSDVWGALAVDPDGKRLWFFLRSEPDRLQVYDMETKSIQVAPLDLAPLRYLKPGLEWAVRDRSPEFKMVWRPDGSQAVFYSQFWTFLLDLKTGQWCELAVGDYNAEAMDIPPWPLQAQWSPNGRYVAFITTDSLQMPFRRTQLTVLDMETGERRTVSPGPDIEPGRHYVAGIAWAPNSQMLTVLATVEYRDGATWEGLYLVEGVTGRSKPVLPHIVFPAGDAGWDLAWSPKGNFLAVTCLYGPLCLVEVSGP
jgi:Tol biopolymer transport system component